VPATSSSSTPVNSTTIEPAQGNTVPPAQQQVVEIVKPTYQGAEAIRMAQLAESARQKVGQISPKVKAAMVEAKLPECFIPAAGAKELTLVDGKYYIDAFGNKFRYLTKENCWEVLSQNGINSLKELSCLTKNGLGLFSLDQKISNNANSTLKCISRLQASKS